MNISSLGKRPEWLVHTLASGSVHWRRLAPRERRLLQAAAAGALAVLVWLTLIDPALQTTLRLRTALPQLRAQAAQLDAVVQQAAELKRQSGGGSIPLADMLPALRSSLTQAGLAEFTAVTQSSAGQWDIVLTQAPVVAVLSWLQDVPFQLRVQPVAVGLERPLATNGKAMSGVVSGSIHLASPAAGQP